MLQEWLNTLDLVLGIVVLTYIAHQMLLARRSYLVRIRLHESDPFYSKQSSYLELVCNSIYGSGRMDLLKIGITLTLFSSFVLLTLQGSFFGITGVVTVGIFGTAKILMSIKS